MKLKNILKLSALVGLGAWWVNRQRERFDETPIQNKVVIVTGASAGIGRATAHAFAKQGAHVVLVARRANILAEVQDELAQYGGRCITIPADMSHDADIEMVIRETAIAFGRIDVLINNAGLVMGGHLEDHDSQKIKQMIDVNLYGAIRMAQTVLPIMKEQAFGHIVNVSSVAGGMFAPGNSAYSATKSGLRSFSVALSRELKNTGVKVSNVMPGWTETDMISELSLDDMLGVDEGFVKVHTADEVAQAIVDAVRFGRRLVVMGGIGMQMGVATEGISHRLGDIFYAYYGEEEFTELMSKYDA